MDEETIEARTQEIGRELLARTRAAAPRFGSLAWFDERGMAWTMGDERLKAQLFRFVDALPGLHDDAAIVSHLDEYLRPVAPLLPAPARWLLGVDRWPVRGLVAGAAHLAVRRLAGRFIAGGTVTEAVRTLTRLRRQHLAFTVDLLGETVLSEPEAEDYQCQYLGLVDGLADAAASWAEDPLIDRGPDGALPRVNLSIKLSALSSRWDPCAPQASSRAVRERLRPVLRRARARGCFVNVDMEHHAYKDLTLRIVQEILDEAEFRDWRDVGIAIQAYLVDCADDLARLADWARRRGTPVWVRLVKGAYWDYETIIAAQNGWSVPVHTDKAASDAAYERLTDFLIERRADLVPALGSHNVRSIAHAIARADAAGLPASAIEFQMLYGMADPLKQAVAGLGRRVRVYTPYGRMLPGMAYLVRRLLENTSNTSFVRAGFLEGAPAERLLMRPVPTIPTPPTGASGFVNHPPADFSRAEAQAAMIAALAAVRSTLPRRCRPVIDGREVDPIAIAESTNPSNRRAPVGHVGHAGPTHAEQAVAAAKAAFPGWRDTPADGRVGRLLRLADLIAERRWEFCALIVLETGKNWRESDADVCEAIDFCRYYADECRRLAVPRRRDVPGEQNELVYDPRGVCAVIAPWNFPLAILCGMATAALAAGNTVVMKPAEQSAVVARELMRACADAGFPAGTVNYLPGVGEDVGPVLVGHPDVPIIAFTGSREVGLAINRRAAELAGGIGEVKRVITEMGGKNAIIVDADADLDEAVQGVMWSAFGYQGQKCSACSRAVVLASVYPAFLERLVQATASLALGSAEDPAAQIGPVIDAEARERIRERIADGRREARVAYAGDVPPELDDQGFYVAPHIFADVPPTSRLAQEEIFGPVLAVMPARDLDEALAIANGTRYALTGGLYSRSPANIARVRRELRVGNVYINRKITGALVDRQPFGGFKLSGIGSKAGGPDYLLQFVVPRCITENTLRHGFTG